MAITQELPNSRFNQMKNHLLQNLDRPYIEVVVWLFGRLQFLADTYVTLAFEDAQVIPPFSREETDGTVNTDYTEDTDYKVDTADTMIEMIQMLEYARIRWNMLELAGIGWNKLEEARICWNMFKYARMA